MAEHDPQIEEIPEQERTERERSFVDTLFFPPEERRLRTGWRLLLQSLVLVGFILGMQFILRYYLYSNFPALFSYDFYISRFILFLGITGTVFAARVILDNRSLKSLGLHLDGKAGLDFAVGMGISFLIAGFLFLVFWALDWVNFQGFAWNVDVPQQFTLFWFIFLVVFSAKAWQEEILFRGYWLKNIQDGLHDYWAIGISALVFSLIHVFSTGFSVRALAALLVLGLFYGYALVSSGQLWLPLGLHLGWKVFGGNLFGFRVNGLQVPGLLIQQLDGPALWTGGVFGPDAGLMIFPALILGSFLIWVYTVSRKG